MRISLIINKFKNTRNLLCLFVYFCAPSLIIFGQSSLAHSSVLINIALNDIDVSPDERKRLQASLNPYFENDVSLISDRYITTNIQLATGKDNSPLWYRSRFALSPLPGFAHFSMAESSPNVGITAVLERPYMLVTDTVAYPVSNTDAALTMLAGQRVDGIIDYSANVALYHLDYKKLDYEILREPTPLFIEFSSMTELNAFERAVSAAIRNGKSTPFGTPQLSKSADEKTLVNFYVLNKSFDTASKKLTPIEDEITAVQWWSTHLPDHDIVLHHSSSSVALAAMASAENVCILNVYKNMQRQEFAYFSKPAVLYLPARIYALANSDNEEKLAAFAKDKPVHLSDWFPRQQDAVFGYSNLVVPLFGDMALESSENKQRFINFEKLPVERVVELLRRNRVDFVIDYPIRLKQARNQAADTSPLTSFEIENETQSTPAYIACSRSPMGRSLLDQIDAILSTPQKVESLFEIYTRGFSSSEIEKYKRDALQGN